jgi:hypothetical protein
MITQEEARLLDLEDQIQRIEDTLNVLTARLDPLLQLAESVVAKTDTRGKLRSFFP